MVQEAKAPFFNMLIWCGRDLICQKTGNLSKTENKRLDLVESGELQINVSVISVVTLRLEENNRVWGQLILLDFEKKGVYPTYTLGMYRSDRGCFYLWTAAQSFLRRITKLSIQPAFYCYGQRARADQ